ncbi:MAG: OsmC family protein [Bryobacteraceae bacterium]
MLEVVVNHLGDVQFEVTARGHRIYCDQPVENGGFDEGMTPPEFLLASLGACAGYYAAQYLKINRLATDGLQVRVQAEKAAKPARLGELSIDVQYVGTLTAKHHAALLDAVRKCLIHNTLLHPPKLEVRVNGAPVALPAVAA